MGNNNINSIHAYLLVELSSTCVTIKGDIVTFNSCTYDLCNSIVRESKFSKNSTTQNCKSIVCLCERFTCARLYLRAFYLIQYTKYFIISEILALLSRALLSMCGFVTERFCPRAVLSLRAFVCVRFCPCAVLSCAVLYPCAFVLALLSFAFLSIALLSPNQILLCVVVLCVGIAVCGCVV